MFENNNDSWQPANQQNGNPQDSAQFMPEIQAENTYFYSEPIPTYSAPERKKGRVGAFIGKAVLSALMVVCISVASVTGYVWLTGSDEPAEEISAGALATSSDNTTVPYVKANYTLSQTEGALTTPEIFVKASPWVVSIVCQYEATVGGFFPGQNILPSSSSGTGIIMSQNGYIMTNHHVVDGASIVTVTVSGKEYEAEIIGLDEKTDIAVIKIEATGLPAAEFGDSSQLVVGEPAIVIGNPLGDSLADTLTQGVISATERQIEFTDSNNSAFYITLIQTDAAVNPGNSGGPLINSRGQVVGVINSKISADKVEGIGFAVPSNMALAIANDLIANGEVTIRPMLGISVRPMSEAQAKQYNEYYKDSIASGNMAKAVPGIIVDSVTPGSAAEKGGMKVGDEIIAFNGIKVKTAAELNYEKEKFFVGDTVTVTVIRDGVQIDLTVSFTAGDVL